MFAWRFQRGRANAVRISLAAERLGCADGTRCPRRVGDDAALAADISACGDWTVIALETDPLAAPPCLRAGVLLAQASQRKSGKEKPKIAQRDVEESGDQ